jgi:O-antigen ligase
MNNKLKIILKMLICVTFFIPLVVVPSSYIFPFVVPKIVWFRSLALLIFGLYILFLATDWEKYKLRLTPINIVVILFFISFTISTFVGVDWYRSFWDNHERMLGLFTIFHYTIYYLVITSVVKEWKEWKWLLRIFLFAGCAVMFIGFLQKFVNPELLLNKGSDRVSATLGNPIYFSGYGLFLMFVGYLLAIKEKIKVVNPWFWFSVAGGLLGFFGIFWGGTRGALLGLLAGLGVLVISYAISLNENKKVRIAMIALIVFGCLSLGLMFLFRQTNFVKNIPTVGRLFSITISGGASNTRLMAWGIALDAWKEKPIFGWGPNNYYYAFNQYYRPEFLENGWGETWFDNAHSVIMNTLAVQGSIGILFYLGIYIVAISLLFRGYKRGNLDAHIVSVGSAFLIAHLISLVTVFENPTSYLYFFFFLAFVNSQILNHYFQSAQKLIDKTSVKRIPWGLAVFVFAVIFLLIYPTNINPAKANKATLDAIRGLYEGKDVEQLYAKASSTPSPHIDDIRNDFSRSAAESMIQFFQNKNYKEADKLFVLAYNELRKNLDLHPLDIRVHLQLAQLAITGAQIRHDMKLLFEAEKYTEEALVLSPKRQQVQYILYPLKLQLDKSKEAIQILQTSIDNDPKISEGWVRLFELYQKLGDIKMAKEVAEDALARGISFNDQQRQFIDSILQSK